MEIITLTYFKILQLGIGYYVQPNTLEYSTEYTEESGGEVINLFAHGNHVKD